MEINEKELNLADVVLITKRRSKVLLAVIALVSVIGAMVAVLLPSVYRSEAVILIEQQEIPSDLVRSTVTSFAEQRIQVMSQRVMSSTNLSRIIAQFGLYTDEKETDTREEILEEMRSNIILDMVSADVVDPKSGRPTEATIAFSLAFENENALKAQQVVNDLVTSFLSDNIKTRTDSAKETTEFLDDEAKSLRRRVTELEGQIAEFKDNNAATRPELEHLTREMLDRTEMRMSEVDGRIHEMTQHKIYLESELAILKPTNPDIDRTTSRILEQFLAVESQLSAAEASYGTGHPDVIRLRQQSEALRRNVNPNSARQLYEDQLSIANQTFDQISKQYGESHPDYAKSKRVVENLQQKLNSLPLGIVDIPNNPAYVALAARLDATNAELESLNIKRQQLMKKLEGYTTNLMLIPDAEAKFRALSRDYETALSKYREISAKQMEARLSQNLESERKGEKFTLIEPPFLSEKPAKPNRPGIVIFSFLLSLLAGFGTVAVIEIMDDKIRGRQDLQEIFNAPPLAFVPVMAGPDDGKPAPAYVVPLAGAVLIGAIGLLTVHFTILPIDVLWFALLRKLGM